LTSVDYFIEQILNSQGYYLLVVIFIAVYCLLFWKKIFGFFDPINLMLFNFVFSGAMVSWLGLTGSIKTEYFIAFCFCAIFFVVGFFSSELSTLYLSRFARNAPRKSRRKRNESLFSEFITKTKLTFSKKSPKQTKKGSRSKSNAVPEESLFSEFITQTKLKFSNKSPNKSSPKSPKKPFVFEKAAKSIGLNRLITKQEFLQEFDLGKLFSFLIVLSIVHAGGLLYVYLNSGLAILTENSAEARVAVSAAGRWGTVILEGSRNTGTMVSMFLLFFHPKYVQRIFASIIFVFFLMSFVAVGSKSAVLTIAFVIGAFSIYLTSLAIKTPKIINTLIVVFLVLGMMYFGYVAGGDISEKFLVRTILSGDTYFYFFVDDMYEKLEYLYNPFIYLLHTITSPFGLKLIPRNIGSLLYSLSTGDYDSGFGPNPQYVVEGMIFMGIYLCPFYALALGYLSAKSRKYFMGKTGNDNFINFTIFFMISPAIPIDIGMTFFNLIASLLVTKGTYYLVNYSSSELLKLLVNMRRLSDRLQGKVDRANRRRQATAKLKR
jgi:hypothetical protein